MSHRPESTSRSLIAPSRLQVADARDDTGADIPKSRKNCSYIKGSNCASSPEDQKLVPCCVYYNITE